MINRFGQYQGYQAIAEYGVIGDCHTIALTGRNGSIDWYCPTRFDGAAALCRLLDVDRGGYLLVAPADNFRVRRNYLDSTNILQSTFDAGEAKVQLIDFMPVHRRIMTRRGHDVGTSRRIIRHIEGLSGEAKVLVQFRPTFDYVQGQTELKPVPGFGALAKKQGRYLSLACPGTSFEFEPDDTGGLCGYLNVKAGERYWLVLTDSDDPDRAMELPTPAQCEQQLARTREYWENWAKNCTYQGPYRKEVLRSALVLKMLTYEPTGAIVAAPTTSLPEEIGGTRNWDYRYTWLRDAALILYALLGIGYEHEAADFFEWLQETHQKDSSVDLQVLYCIDGQREMSETVLDHLEGYKRSRPVRIGNAAAGQLQLDIYGEILTAANLYFTSGIGSAGAESSEFSARQRLLTEDWPLLRSVVNRAVDRWQEPDNGIWEVRGGRQHFLYSKLMCWAAVDRGIKLAEEHLLQAPLKKWHSVRESIRQTILSSGFNQERESFVQSLGGSVLDASVLTIPRVGFLSATDPRFQSTINQISSQLTHNGLVYRYRSHDGLPGSEATFALCTFWLIDALALSGKTEEAHSLFERVVSYANDLGLLSEEIDPLTGELLGNFPQGFTHMALINSAVNLAKVVKHGAEKEPETEAERASRGRLAAKEHYR